MGALGWDHNAYYEQLLMRQLPRPCRRVLDVGCGAARSRLYSPPAQNTSMPSTGRLP